MRYSIVVPVYNRPDECDELLESLLHQTVKDFEVIIVEDGSSVPCAEIVERYASQLNVRYFAKPNSGPGQTRNYGVERAVGDYVIILDSDVLVPSDYLAAIDAELAAEPCDAFGGPDRAHSSFTPMQKAINFAMTSFFTTGGIRGGKTKMDKFYPRSFNMGVKREVYDTLGGFSAMRFGEDIDFSTRIFKKGYRCRLFPEAWVFHKRRTDLRKFFKQVHNSGIARINLTKRHPGTLKAVHLLPAVFTLGIFLCLLGAVVSAALYAAGSCESDLMRALPRLFLAPIEAYSFLILLSATITTRSFIVGILAVPAAFVQLMGYGTGFLRGVWERLILGHGEFEAFKKNFYQ